MNLRCENYTKNQSVILGRVFCRPNDFDIHWFFGSGQVLFGSMIYGETIFIVSEFMLNVLAYERPQEALFAEGVR